MQTRIPTETTLLARCCTGVSAAAAVLLVASSASATTPGASEEMAPHEQIAQLGETSADIGETSADVAAEVGDDAEELDVGAEESSRIDLPVSINASLGTGFSLGTVFRDNYTTTDAVSLRFGLGVSYPFWDDRLSASMNLGYAKNLTPTGINRRYEGRFSDIGLGLGYGNIYTIPVAEIGIGASFGLSVPVSEISRFEGLVTATDLGLSLSRGFGLFSLSYGFGVSKNFHRYTTQTVNLDRRRDLDVLFRTGSAEEVAENRVAIDSGVLPEWGVSNSLSFGVRWFETGLSSSLSFSLADSFSYAVDSLTERDEFTPDFAVVGRGRSQSMSGSIGLNYSFLQYFSAGMSLTTGGPPKSADNRRFRFPFFDTESGNLQYTSLSFRLSASI